MLPADYFTHQFLSVGRGKEARPFKDLFDAVSDIRELRHTENEEEHLDCLCPKVLGDYFGRFCSTGGRRRQRRHW